MNGREGTWCLLCAIISSDAKRNLWFSILYILTKKTHLNTVFHWNLLAYNYLRVIPIYGGRVKGGKYWTVVYCFTTRYRYIRKSKKNVLFITILFYPKMALKLMFALIYVYRENWKINSFSTSPSSFPGKT